VSIVWEKVRPIFTPLSHGLSEVEHKKVVIDVTPPSHIKGGPRSNGAG
jgi:hypothetical protein